MSNMHDPLFDARLDADEPPRSYEEALADEYAALDDEARVAAWFALWQKWVLYGARDDDTALRYETVTALLNAPAETVREVAL